MHTQKNAVIRFESGMLSIDYKYPCGLFTFSYDLLDDPDVELYFKDELKQQLAWFEEHLPDPDIIYDATHYVFWYKLSATEFINRMWCIVSLLESQGYYINVYMSEFPNDIIYQDDIQVAARRIKWK